MEVEKQIIEEEAAAAATSTAASSVNGSSEVNRAVTWEGCSVLLDINDGDRLVFSRLSPAAYTLSLSLNSPNFVRKDALAIPLLNALAYHVVVSRAVLSALCLFEVF